MALESLEGGKGNSLLQDCMVRHHEGLQGAEEESSQVVAHLAHHDIREIQME